jgi:hypothetical protein
MKKLCVISLAMALLMMPFALPAQVETAAGSMTLGAHIDFAARYSVEDGEEDPADRDPGELYWAGYETFNLEAAVISLMGEVGDNVSYCIMIAPVLTSYLNDQANPAAMTNPLLDARITWAVTDSVALNMGRYIPHTSMSNGPHMMSVHHLNDPPMMIRGSGYQLNLTPLPLYQTGIGLEATMGPATITWDFYDGVENNPANVSTLSDQDKSKGGVLKIAVDSGNIHFGGYFLEEYSEAAGVDHSVASMGVEGSYTTERMIIALEGLQTVNDPLDDQPDPTSPGDFFDTPATLETTYYLLVGGNVGPVMVVFRYDWADSGQDEFADDLADEMDGDGVDEDAISDQELVYTLGVNYELNENTTVGVNYNWRQPEVPADMEEDELGVDINGDGDLDDSIDWEYPNINEISILVELNAL